MTTKRLLHLEIIFSTIPTPQITHAELMMLFSRFHLQHILPSKTDIDRLVAFLLSDSFHNQVSVFQSKSFQYQDSVFQFKNRLYFDNGIGKLSIVFTKNG